ncbi:hypothetical protein [Methylosinus sp. PW1]|uniref:hypothetical protein n=1 Tax=Methylosinus sp. PW1 TaxID=107636 RepID=UPI0012EBD465|nr:hypothetical protein [Methylosinus sp. PW1]
MVAEQIHNGCSHLRLTSGDNGETFLVPAWMVESEASTIGIVDLVRFPVAQLLELRAFLDSVLASDLRVGPEGGADGNAIGELAGRLVRGDAAEKITNVSASAADATLGADPNPIERSDDGGRYEGDGR